MDFQTAQKLNKGMRDTIATGVIWGTAKEI